MSEQVERKHNYKVVLLIILLLLTIAFLTWLLLRPQSGAKRIPTGNVDIFKINISCSCGPAKKDDDDDDDDKDDKDDEDCDKNDISSIVRYSGIVNNRPNTTVQDDGIVYADDNEGWYVYQRNLKIFENAAFQYTNKIAPGVSNSYDFRVNNTTLKAINYSVNFEENTEYAINLRYRLKREGNYVVGGENEWVSASELDSAMKYLPSNGVDNYTLDWEWPYEGGTDDADTEAGENMTSEYTLGIKIMFEEA